MPCCSAISMIDCMVVSNCAFSFHNNEVWDVSLLITTLNRAPNNLGPTPVSNSEFLDCQHNLIWPAGLFLPAGLAYSQSGNSYFECAKFFAKVMHTKLSMSHSHSVQKPPIYTSVSQVSLVKHNANNLTSRTMISRFLINLFSANDVNIRYSHHVWVF